MRFIYRTGDNKNARMQNFRTYLPEIRVGNACKIIQGKLNSIAEKSEFCSTSHFGSLCVTPNWIWNIKSIHILANFTWKNITKIVTQVYLLQVWNRLIYVSYIIHKSKIVLLLDLWRQISVKLTLFWTILPNLRIFL